MGVLFDTDAFCKLGAAGLLDAALELLGAEPKDCARLPALPHMLRRGGLRKRLGDSLSDRLLPLADAMAIAPEPSTATLEALRALPEIDPGEAKLLSLVAERGDLLVTSDKRALRALANVPLFALAISGKIVLLEILLLELCKRNGESFVRSGVAPVLHVDTMLRVCFSPGSNSTESLLAYVKESTATLTGICWTVSE